jgi:hypothetical protein
MNETIDTETPILEPIARLSRDIRQAALTLGDDEARFLVDAYYLMQDDRKRTYAQERTLGNNAEPNQVISWLADQSATLENQIKSALDVYTKAHVMGSWMREVTGIGPVISAGLLAHIDIEKCPTVGHIWQFAGIAGEGQKKWEKGTKRPHNAQLKTLCWKLGQSFMKLSNHPDCIYGQHYRAQKDKYLARNVASDYHERALARASTVGKSTEAYKHYSTGKLPPAHIDAMARRWAVKLFLVALHGEWYQRHFGRPAPLPYPISILGHAHQI